MQAIIIEDEKSSKITLSNMLMEYCPEVKIMTMVGTVKEGVKAIQTYQPELIFLDIELPGENGFKLFDYFTLPSFDVIFTTAYDEFALRALKMSAVDFLLKPIDLEELQIAIQKVIEKRKIKTNEEQWKILKENLSTSFKKLALPTGEGLYFVALDDIVRCEAQGSYSMFFLKNGEKVMVSRILKTYTDILETLHFFRIRRSQLINLNQIKKFGRQKSPTVTLNDGTVLSLSLARKDEFLQKIKRLIRVD